MILMPKQPGQANPNASTEVSLGSSEMSLDAIFSDWSVSR